MLSLPSLEETLAQIVLLEVLGNETEDLAALEEELNKLTRGVMGQMPNLILERQNLSSWGAVSCKVLARKISSPRLRKFLRKLDKNMTLGNLCLFTRREILKFNGVGPTTCDELERLMGATLPAVSPVVVLAFYGRAGTEIRDQSLIGRAMPKIFSVRRQKA